MHPRALGALVVASACWASANLFAKAGLATLPPMTLLAIQLAAATAVLWVALLVRGYRRPARMGLIATMGVLEPAIAYAAVNLGLTLTSASDASLLAGTETVFVVLLAWMFLGQRPSARTLGAVALAVAGVMVISGSAPSTDALAGNALVLLGALSAAGYVVVASRVAPDSDALALTAHQFLFGTIASAPFIAVQWSLDGPVVPASAPASAWVWATLAGIVGLALSFLLYNYALANVSSTTAGLSLTLIPVFGVLGAVLFLGEPLRLVQLAGAALILLGLIAYSTATRAASTTAT